MRYKIEFIIGASLFGTLGVLRRLTPFPSGFITVFRLGSSVIALMLLLMVLRQKTDWQAIRANLKYLVISGLCLGMYMITAFESYLYTTVAKAELCFYIAPIVVVLLSPLFFDERINLRKVICLITALIGLVLVSGVLDDTEKMPKDGLGIALALITAAMLVAVMIVNKKIQGLSGMERTEVQFIIGLAATIPYAIVKGDFMGLEFTASGVFFLLVTSLISTAFAYILYFRGIEHLPMQTSAMLSYLEPVMAVVLSAIFLGEIMPLPQIVGAVLLIGSAIVCQRE